MTGSEAGLQGGMSCQEKKDFSQQNKIVFANFFLSPSTLLNQMRYGYGLAARDCVSGYKKKRNLPQACPPSRIGKTKPFLPFFYCNWEGV